MAPQDPSNPQKLAAAPTVSAWVSASAGTGKTKVLTDRLLNLMLTGQDPAKILCLTFTKAAAAEMQTRLFQRLSSWVQMTEDQLTVSLEELWQGDVTANLKQQARSLFTQILDLPGGIKIQTIHGFCQSILGRFPLEARIPPQFSIIDDTTAIDLLRRSTAKILHEQALNHPGIFSLLALYFKDQSFEDILGDLISRRSHLRHLSQESLESYIQKLCQSLELPSVDLRSLDLKDQFIYEASLDKNYDRATLLDLLNDKPNSTLEKWLSAPPGIRVQLYDDYSSLFLTQKNEIRKSPKINSPEEAERIWRLSDRLKRLEIAQKSLVLYYLGSAVYRQYQQQKLIESALDYDDLIDKTIELLTDPELAAWVLYKLDGGIDHILVDEAQDTNPAQWDVVKALTQEFFRPDKAHRTLFVVGDSKQSIYSFQGADPQDFINLRHYFSQQSQAIGQTWRTVDLSVSFRSTPQILNLVDRVFADPSLRERILAESNLVHTPFRQSHQGVVRLWPTILKDEEKKEKAEPWRIPSDRIPTTSIEQDCAVHVAQQISDLLRTAPTLPSTQQPIQPKDILILVRQRSPFIPHLIRHLKHLNVPVAGADRFSLTDHLAIKDLLSLGQFLLQPLDDLSLATVLTSPLIGLSHQNLMELSMDRGGSLWAQLLKQKDSKPYQQAFNWLKGILDKTDFLSPFELFSYVLYELDGKRRILSRLSHEAEDVLAEFLTLLLNLERQLSPNLESVMGELLSQNYQLKRDASDTQHNEIRIMTIHGSKGLQAPIVILADKFGEKKNQAKILWRQDVHGRCDLLLIHPRKEQDIDLTQQLKAQATLKDDAEDKRLLYVALTRAQDHLYVCGYGGKIDGSWYDLLQENGVETQEWSCLSTAQNDLDFHTSRLQLPNFLTSPVDLTPHLKPLEDKQELTPEAHRGIIIHRLLEILPGNQTNPRQIASQVITKMTSDPELQVDCLETSLKLLGSPELKVFFGEESVAELEILTDTGDLVRLDRVVLGRTIKILDYKSSKTPPISATHIPASIKKQLDSYKSALNSLYPDTPIDCYILWTSNGRLDSVG